MVEQRQRLLDGMVHVASRDGYAAATVARVIEWAGVSRATFYEQFAGREDCFRAACRRIVVDLKDSVCLSLRADPKGDPFLLTLRTLLGSFASDPAAARLVLVEVLGAGPSARYEHEQVLAELEARLERLLEHDPGPQALQLPVTALLGGMAGTISMHAFQNEAETYEVIANDLLAWVECYRLPPGQERWSPLQWRRAGSGAPRSAVVPAGTRRPALPRGRSALPSAKAARVRRDRILAATAALAAARGYPGLTVTDIAASASVTRGAFYSHFRGKEDAFLAAQGVGLQESVGAAAAAFFGPREWPERVWAATSAALGYMASHPDLAYMCTLETHSAGREALRRQHDARTAYTLFLEEGFRLADSPPPRRCADMIAWAIFALIRRTVLDGRAADLGELTPQAAYVILSPFMGSVAALEFVEARSRSAG